MATSITTINTTDLITNSKTDLNNNFSSLNTNKIETSYLDTDTSLTANSDSKIATQRAVKAYVDVGGNVNASTTTRGIVEEATAAEVAAGTATGATGARLFINPSSISSLVKKGGTGDDGALTITSGVTNYDLASATIFTKNFTSISITGTGSVTFTNPNSAGTVIVFKSQGDITLTSSSAPMINCKNTGGLFGAGANGGGTGNTAGTNGHVTLIKTFGGATGVGGGGGGGSLTAGTASTSAGGALASLLINPAFSSSNVINDTSLLFVGAGGGGGVSGAGAQAGFNGGSGGGALIIECAGAWNFTTTGGISVSGTDGPAGYGTGSNGGGGGGGYCKVLYTSLTANSGTILSAGGAGGTGGAIAGGAGGTGYSIVEQY